MKEVKNENVPYHIGVIEVIVVAGVTTETIVSRKVEVVQEVEVRKAGVVREARVIQEVDGIHVARV